MEFDIVVDDVVE